MLEARDLALARAGRRLVDGLSLRLERGRVLAVLGPNGAGKSSLLLALAGLLPIRWGVLELAGRPLSRWPRRELAQRIAWQGSQPPTEFGLTVAERLALARGAPGDARAVASALDALDLRGLGARRLGELSAGERQRAELAAVLLRDAPVWLLDEPTAHLDLKHQAAWLRALRREADAGRAVAVVLHDLEQATHVADDALLLFGDGRALAGAAPQLLVREVLEPLFETPLRDSIGPDGRRRAVPDWSNGREPARTAAAPRARQEGDL